jgi:hypothetical protein
MENARLYFLNLNTEIFVLLKKEAIYPQCKKQIENNGAK